MTQGSDYDADHHRDHDQNHHRSREPDRDPIYRNEPIPRRKLTDAQVISAVETIAYYAVQQAEAETTHHVHLLPFDNLTQQQPRAVISLLSWLALDTCPNCGNLHRPRRRHRQPHCVAATDHDLLDDFDRDLLDHFHRDPLDDPVDDLHHDCHHPDKKLLTDGAVDAH